MQRADKRKYHYIYKITRDDGKYYIGMHSTDNMDDGYFGSGKLITRSIKKYGLEKHSKEILEYLPSRVNLKIRERELVTEEILADNKCMNLVIGGNGGCSKETQFARSSAGGKNPGKAFKGSGIMKAAGIKSAATQRKLIQDGLILPWQGRSFLGKKHSESTKQKMKKSKNVGAYNSQYGTCWVTKGLETIKIGKEKLQSYLENGYIRGRKFENVFRATACDSAK